MAGGKGERMGESTPKQFLELNGKPILMHTIEKFLNTFQNIKIIIALPENQFDYWEELCIKHQFINIPLHLVKGGKTRFQSVKNALSMVKSDGIVGIHDGVRPLVSEAVIKACYQAAATHGNVIPVVEMVDSLRFVSKQEGTNKAVPRSCYKIVQTPQCFKSELILKAYDQDEDDSFTDDASVLEKMGETIHLVEGNRDNVKITTKEDLAYAEAIIGA